MLAGVTIAVISVLLLMQYRHFNGPRSLAIALGIIGIVIYISGRIALFFKNRNTRQSEPSEPPEGE